MQCDQKTLFSENRQISLAFGPKHMADNLEEYFLITCKYDKYCTNMKYRMSRYSITKLTYSSSFLRTKNEGWTMIENEHKALVLLSGGSAQKEMGSTPFSVTDYM